MSYQHIIWDWNGTLFDDLDLCIDIMNGILKKYSKELLTVERYQRIFVFPVKEYYFSMGFNEAGFSKVSHEFIAEYEKRKFESDLHIGVREILKDISSKGISQSILSAYKQDTLIETVEHFQIQNHFIKLIGQDDIYAHGKIDQGKKWIKELGFDKKDVLMIGDTDHDFEVAEKMEIDCILIPMGHNSKERLLNTKATILSEISQFPIKKF